MFDVRGKMRGIGKRAWRFGKKLARQQPKVYWNHAETKQYEHLKKLHISTRALMQFQADIVDGMKSYKAQSSKQRKIGNELSRECGRYVRKDAHSKLSKAALRFSRTCGLMNNAARDLSEALNNVASAYKGDDMLKEARRLAKRFKSMRQETKAQAVAVSEINAKLRKAASCPETRAKMSSEESQQKIMRSSLAELGQNATDSLANAEAAKQELTLEALKNMAEAQVNYHKKVLTILRDLQSKLS